MGQVPLWLSKSHLTVNPTKVRFEVSEECRIWSVEILAGRSESFVGRAFRTKAGLLLPHRKSCTCVSRNVKASFGECKICLPTSSRISVVSTICIVALLGLETGSANKSWLLPAVQHGISGLRNHEWHPAACSGQIGCTLCADNDGESARRRR